jgi:hypothetical protein
MTKVEKDDLIAALRLRYDFYSAQTIFDAALARAELRDQDLYSEVELSAFREALSRVGDRLTAVEERIESLIDTPAKPAPEAKPEPKVEATVEAKPEPEPDVATIALVGLELDPGEAILVCGSFVDWNPDRAIAMTRDGDGWQVKVPAGANIAFKFMRKRADGTLLWEPGDDRTLVGKHVEATWRVR